MRGLPTGTVTFLFTDVAGSTRLLREHGAGYAELLGDHRRATGRPSSKRAVSRSTRKGDAFFVAFTRASDAVAAAQEGI